MSFYHTTARHPIPAGVPVTPTPAPQIELCHCGREIYHEEAIIENGKPFTRGLCRECDTVRCDAYPMDCPY